MEKLLKILYDRFYVPSRQRANEKEIEACYHHLKSVLDQPDCKVLLRIIDAKDRKKMRAK